MNTEPSLRRVVVAVALGAAALAAVPRGSRAAEDAKPPAAAKKGDDDGAKEGEAKRDAADDPARAALERVSPKVNFDGVQLGDVIDFLMDVFNVPIRLDQPALGAAGINLVKSPISMDVAAGDTLEQVLTKLAERIGTEDNPAAFDVVGSVVVISTKEDVGAYVARHRAALARAAGPALDRELPEVTFDGVGLAGVLDFLRDVTNVRYDADWAKLKEVGVTPEMPVTVRARGVKYAQALQLVLDDASAAAKQRVGFTVKGDRIVIAVEPEAPKTPAKKAKPKPGGL
jgi:hypothetical protein